MSTNIIKGSEQWEQVKQAAYNVAKDVGNVRYANEKINKIFADEKTQVSFQEVAQIFDRDNDGRIVLDEFDGNLKGVCPFVVYNWEDEGRDGQYEYYCIRMPQQNFQNLAKLFHENHDEILNYVSDVKGFQLREYESNPKDSNDFGNNIPLLLQGYEPFLTGLSKYTE